MDQPIALPLLLLPDRAFVGRAGKAIGDKIVVIGQWISRLPCPYYCCPIGRLLAGRARQSEIRLLPDRAFVGRAGKAIGDKIVVIGQWNLRLPCPYDTRWWGPVGPCARLKVGRWRKL
jgi:hypothetical protein